MSEDEVFVLILSISLAGISWCELLVRIHQSRARIQRSGVRRWLFAAPLGSFLITLLVLLVCSSQDVRNDPEYLFLYLMFGAAWVGLFRLLIPLYGISARDDVLERHNRAGAVAWFGAVLAFGLCFAGGNIGDGPGWPVVLFAAVLATGSLLLLWAVFERLTNISEIITIDRDMASGLRLAGWLVATGIVLGAGVAGDWNSPWETVRDFLQRAWPALIFLGAAVAIERHAKSIGGNPAQGVLTLSVLPVTSYLVLASLWVAFIGLDP